MASKTVKHADVVAVVTPAAPVQLVATAPAATLPLGVSYSLHDCQYPWQAGLHNMVWPIGMAGNIGGQMKNGLVMICRDPTVSATVVTA